MMAAHTNGKLFVECQSSDMIEIQTETGRSIAFVGDDDDRVDNARRLVAAWNACEGISTEELEDGAIQKLREIAENPPDIEDW
jgi:hypothetical protein